MSSTLDGGRDAKIDGLQVEREDADKGEFGVMMIGLQDSSQA